MLATETSRKDPNFPLLSLLAVLSRAIPQSKLSKSSELESAVVNREKERIYSESLANLPRSRELVNLREQDILIESKSHEKILGC